MYIIKSRNNNNNIIIERKNKKSTHEYSQSVSSSYDVFKCIQERYAEHPYMIYT
jgi:hypothetical protein